MTNYDYDLFVIGAGSGGVRAGRLAASLGKRVGITEEYRYGGTCVIRGCIPKKLFVYASQFSEHFEDAAGYGWTVPEPRFDWPTLIANKDKEIARLEGLYRKGLDNAGADSFESRAELVDRHTVKLIADGRHVTARHILIATGGAPNHNEAMPGHELCITSDDAFGLKELPKAIVIAGGGYICVEFANIFHGLGVETTMVYHGPEILKRFDVDLRRGLQAAMEKKGIRIVRHAVFERVDRAVDGRLNVTLSNGETLIADEAMLSLGRNPNTRGLGLEAAGVEIGKGGKVLVDEFSRTNVDNIWAIGDVTDRVQLTPVAIHEAICLVETVFKDNPTRPDHETIPTAVFSQPEIGTVGLSEDDAAQKFDDLEIYMANFRPLKHTLSGRDEKMLLKLVVDASNRRVLGAHILGADAGEMAQLLGVSVKAKLTKDDFDRTMALHPTAAEELVTMYRPSYRVKAGHRVD